MHSRGPEVESPGPAQSAYAFPLLVVWSLIELAMTLNNGAYVPKAVALLTVALGLLVAGLFGLLRSRPWTASAGLACAAGVSLAVSFLYDAGLYGSGRSLTWSRDLAIAAAVAALVATSAQGAARVAALGIGAVSAVTALWAMVVASPRPAIDVWFILTVGSRRLLEGHNLFTSCWPGNTDPATNCVYPYGPMTTLVQTPFRLVLGDIRYAYVAALVVAALAVAKLAGPSLGPVLGLLVLVSPKLTFLIEQAWTEPLLLAGLAVMVLAATRGHGVLAMLGFGFALACKQHILLLVPLAAWWPAFGVRRTAIAVAGAGLVTLPWFVANPHAFLADAVRYHLNTVPRRDSLSLYAYALSHGHRPAAATVAVAVLAAWVVAMTVLPRTAFGFAAGSALAQFALDYTNKQSFFNQWWLVANLLVVAIAAEVGAAVPSTEVAAATPEPLVEAQR